MHVSPNPTKSDTGIAEQVSQFQKITGLQFFGKKITTRIMYTGYAIRHSGRNLRNQTRT